jgi:uncharacterized paraquat-inducible protein A
MSRQWERSKRDPHGIAHPEDKRVCDECDEVFSARNGNRSGLCPSCAREVRRAR